ncbi:ShKT domain-containing protein [Caenorhabditis elegans]|uniref:ShKT domain-containing protein n=1 Tax=Caenorhabditis elegans TaxID=6239 RepID=Q4TT94_CAEEL|nr:ShKT domain-containing protein [Caenorhabditis elegans]CCD67636.1 ShKT domain-containing protein [Caenorhabditis elegans]|eukprot:NP_001023243.1 Uncharacterized protein CELE_F58F9.8 [Caenorhabditis elegans]
MLNFCHILFFLLSTGVQALPTCSYDVCAKGGMWTEWSTTEPCPTNCGSCAKILYTRKCLSTNFPNCACVGDTTRYILCNTKTCVYPAQRTCCIPYVPMIINGTSQCGPFPKDTGRSSEAPCCPKDGFWSDWSAYKPNSNNTAFVRSRKCLSEASGCPCANPTTTMETRTDCPCRKLVEVGEQVKSKNSYYPMIVVYDDPSCTAYQTLKAFNDAANGEVPCNSWKGYVYATVIRYVKPTGGAPVEQRMSNCVSGGNQRATFFCDTDTLYYRAEISNDEVVGFSQINIIT